MSLLNEKLLLKAAEVAEMLSMGPRTLWSKSISGEIPSFKIGRLRFYSLESIKQWIADQSGGNIHLSICA